MTVTVFLSCLLYLEATRGVPVCCVSCVVSERKDIYAGYDVRSESRSPISARAQRQSSPFWTALHLQVQRGPRLFAPLHEGANSEQRKWKRGAHYSTAVAAAQQRSAAAAGRSANTVAPARRRIVHERQRPQRSTTQYSGSRYTNYAQSTTDRPRHIHPGLCASPSHYISLQ